MNHGNLVYKVDKSCTEFSIEFFCVNFIRFLSLINSKVIKS